MSESSGGKVFWIIAIVAALAYCGRDKPSAHEQAVVTTESGAGHEVTYRDEPPEEQEDDPDTTNDESNDQPLRHFGTETLCIASASSGNTYTLDVELDDNEVSQIYFPKGGWLYFTGCELDDELNGECVDDHGDSWEFQGKC